MLVSRTAADLEAVRAKIAGEHNVSVRYYALDLGDSRNIDKLAAECADTDLLIVGKGQDEAHLRAIGAELAPERVRFLGWRDDIEAVLAAGDIFVCPSRHEPLGNVVIEAFAQGLPVLA